jgi:(1->4)-alpha-D-glucan 1-alpha-D-glucosylmutase
MPEPPAGPPRATYRLQLNAEFGFAAARRVVPYLARLGISHLYASPLTMARPGSGHGYDVIDFNRLNPELGDEAAFNALVAELHGHGMGLILDFVPNHMGVGADNPWWLDVLEWGQESPFASFFDIDWEASARGVRDKLLLPVLGDQYGLVLEAGELQLGFDAATGSFAVRYYDNVFPIGLRQYPRLLQEAADRLGSAGGALTELAWRFGGLGAGGSSRARRGARRQEAAALKAELATLAGDATARAALEAAAVRINGRPGQPQSFRALHRLLEEQAYRLAYWRVASSEINYRRFFDINELAGLRMERPEVFEATHRLLLRLIAEGKVQGVRLDHIDGLYDPRGYCERLLARVAEVLPRAEGAPPPALDAKAGQPIYLVVEKILARHEYLREDLPVAGTTGYEFIGLAGGLFVDPSAERQLTATYHRFIGEEPDFGQVVVAAKRQILRYALNSELHVLAHELHRLAQQSWRTRDFTLTGLREALGDVIACFPVYRTYITAAGAKAEDRRDLDWAISQARRASNLVDLSVFDFLHAALSTDLAASGRYRRRDVIATAMHFQQLTGPVTAKAVEDTAFYRYVRLISLNEVGGEPQHFGTSPSAFHTVVQQTQRFHPLTMLASATHDHKRGEDVRARLNGLSELAPEWRRRVRRFALLNRLRRQEIAGRRVPSRNDEYLLYQTLIGAWPLEIEAPEALAASDFAERIVAYMIKALREAKQETSWTAPDPAYEDGVAQFVRRILDPVSGRAFIADLLPFQAEIARIGAVNGLAQTLLKLTAPGVPDSYQGTELWDLSLVDPDNRRPVDFERRGRWLAEPRPVAELLADWRSGRIKQQLIARTLAFRRRAPAPFRDGDYLPLTPAGTHAERIVAFARRTDQALAIVIVPRLIAPLLRDSELPLPPPLIWADTEVELPEGWADAALRDELTGRPRASPPSGRLAIAELLAELPVALLSAAPAA